MSKESYARGFCKSAEAYGVDPTALAKYAAESGGGIENPLKDDFEFGKDLPAPSSPSWRDWTYLTMLDPGKMIQASDKAGLTVGDYLDTLYGISNEHGIRAAYGFDESKKSMPLSHAIGEATSAPVSKISKFISLFPSSAAANFSTITNLLDRAGRATGKPLWDVKNVRPTLYGVMRTPYSPTQSGPKLPHK